MANETQLLKTGRTIDEITNKAVYAVGIVRPPNLNNNYENINYFETTLSNVVSIEIRDSIESYYRTGTILLSDRIGFRSSAPLTGNEIISVKYKNNVYAFEDNIPSKIVHFRIFGVEEVEDPREQNSNPGCSLIKIDLVEFPAFDMLTYNEIYKTFAADVAISQYVRDMLSDITNLSKHYDIEVDKSKTDLTMPYYSPNWSPIKNIEYLKNFLLDEKSRGFWAMNVVDPEKEGKRPIIKFGSVLKYLEEKTARNYGSLKTDTFYKPPNRPGSVNEKNKIDKTIRDFGDDRQYAPLDFIFERPSTKWGSAMKYLSGLFGKTFAHYSFEEGAQYNAMDYQSFLKNYKSLGKYSTISLKNQSGNQWASFGYLPHNNPAIVQAYNTNTFYYNQFKQLTMEIKTPLNQTRSNGEIANIILPVPQVTGNMVDFMMSGKWLTWEINDFILADGTAYSKITLCRDSFWLVDNKDKYLTEMSSYEDSKLGGGYA
jgi:hypothetical protein